MTAPLSPLQSALFADSAYALQSQTDLRAAEAAAGAARGLFSIASGKRFEATTGLNARTGFGYVAFGEGARVGECLVSVRGTSTAHDWLTDGHFAGTRGTSGFTVHAGFHSVAQAVLPQVREALRGRNPSTIHVLGHSLGGAAATLVADALAGKAEIKLYSFGAPRSGDIFHARYLSKLLGTENIYRVYHDTDPVPMVPLFPYGHIPIATNQYMLAGSGNVISFSAHKMGLYQKNVGKSGWAGLPLIDHRRFSFETVDDALAMAASSTFGPAMFSAGILRLIGQALRILTGGVKVGLGMAGFAAATILDEMATLLMTGAAASLAVAETTRNLMQTSMRFMGRTLAAGVQLSVAFIRWVLQLLFKTVATLARRAVEAV